MTTGITAAISIADYAAQIGRNIGCSRWIVIDQERIDRFADAIEDRYFIHVDPKRARAESPFGGTIAHGFLSLSLLSTMMEDVRPEFREPLISINYGIDRVRFLSPVPAGSRVRGCFTLSDMNERRSGEYQLRHQVTVEIEGGKRPALIADWLTMLMVRDDGPS